LTEDTKGFVGIFFQEDDDFVELEIVVVFGDRLGVVEFVIVGIADNFKDGEGGGGTNEEIFVDQFDEIFQNFIVVVD
jgi:hypothetical protein